MEIRIEEGLGHKEELGLLVLCARGTPGVLLLTVTMKSGVEEGPGHTEQLGLSFIFLYFTIYSRINK